MGFNPWQQNKSGGYSGLSGDWFQPIPLTGIPWLDSYINAQNQSKLTNLERYQGIRGGGREANAAMGGYLGRYNRGMKALEGREDEIVEQFADMEGGLKNDALNRGLITSKTYQDVGDLGKQRAGALSQLARERADLDARLSGDTLSFMERRADQGPNLQLAAQAAQMAGAGGVGFGYGGGQRSLVSRFPGLEGRGHGYGGMPPGMKFDKARNSWYTDHSTMGGSAGVDPALRSDTQHAGTMREYFKPGNPALVQSGLGPLSYGRPVWSGGPAWTSTTKAKQWQNFPTQGEQGDQHVG